ncbi:unnamed protein product [Trichogramma brassicae]|uniref:Uncharacterized protein n=1 Tax=Trichogramma brassicae TaxID=86971 RepID=A0A6H5IKT1_9HYME|nr:unnamed protein product [Trichogramma brassicae]
MEALHARTIVDMSSSPRSSEKPDRMFIAETTSAKQSPSKVRALNLRLPIGGRLTLWFSSRKISNTMAWWSLPVSKTPCGLNLGNELPCAPAPNTDAPQLNGFSSQLVRQSDDGGLGPRPRSLISIAVTGVRAVSEPSSPLALFSFRPSSPGLTQALSSRSSSSPPALRRTLLTLLTESCSVGSDLRSFRISA